MNTSLLFTFLSAFWFLKIPSEWLLASATEVSGSFNPQLETLRHSCTSVPTAHEAHEGGLGWFMMVTLSSTQFLY